MTIINLVLWGKKDLQMFTKALVAPVNAYKNNMINSLSKLPLTQFLSEHGVRKWLTNDL